MKLVNNAKKARNPEVEKYSNQTEEYNNFKSKLNYVEEKSATCRIEHWKLCSQGSKKGKKYEKE